MSDLSKSLRTAAEGCVIFFVKAPKKGEVKTRLAASLGHSAVQTLYKAFVADLMDMLGKGCYSLTIAFHPPEGQEEVEKWLGRGHQFIPQCGEHLGERMKGAFETVFAQGAEAAVIIGSDTPDLPCAFIDEAFLALRHCDAVIGPSVDGGYYLIGFRKETLLARSFEEIPWSSAEVSAKTMDIFRENRLNVHVLPQLRDIDTFDDLRVLFHENIHTDFAESVTMKYLRKKKKDLL